MMSKSGRYTEIIMYACRFVQILKSAVLSMAAWIPLYFLSVRLMKPQRFSAIMDDFATYLLLVIGVCFVVALCISVAVKLVVSIPFFSTQQKRGFILIGCSYWYMPFILLRVLGGDVMEMREWGMLLFFYPLIFLPIPALLLYLMDRAIRSDAQLITES